jgi:two-component system, sensor histidine kinase and response regulator
MKTRRILTVDDDIQSTRMIKLILERTGRYEVMEVNDSTRVLEAAHEFKPDVILLDVCMPRVEGVELAFQVRADSELQDIPVVFLTATVSEQEAVGDGASGGGFHFVAKPARLSRLITCIEKSLEQTGCKRPVPAEGQLV